MLKVKVSFYKETIAIIELTGDLTVFEKDFDLFSKEMMAYMKMGIFKFILNLQYLNYIDSSGVGVLLRMASVAARNNTKLCILCDKPNIQKVLSISKVDFFSKQIKEICEGIKFFESTSD